MAPTPGIILQARVASTRLPGKVLEPLGGRTILHQCLARLIESGAGRVVLATTDRPEDDALVRVAMRLGVPVHRGDSEDVLARFLGAAEAFDLDPIVRATADNPAVDVHAPGRLLAALRASKADYVREEGLPYGAGVEALTRAALRYAADNARDPHDREHVTTFIRSRHDLFRVLTASAPLALHRPSLRLTVDTPADLAWVRELYFRTGTDAPSLRQLIVAASQAQRDAA